MLTSRVLCALFRCRSQLLVPAALIALSACQGGEQPGSSSGLAVGSLVDHPDPTIGSERFRVDPNSGGRAPKLHLAQVSYGRLVDVMDVSGKIVARDFVVSPEVSSNAELSFARSLATGHETLSVLHLAGSPAFDALLGELEQGLVLVRDVGLEAGELPPFSLLPRNGCIVLRFDDLLAASAISLDTARLVSGYPPTAPTAARVLADRNHGDLADFDDTPGLEFHTTRILVTAVVTPFDATVSNPPLSENGLGFPGSVTLDLPNLGLRLPTRLAPDVGILAVLRNPSGHALWPVNSGSTDATSPSVDVVRALRTGGVAGVLDDLHNGFLPDFKRPRVLAELAATIETVAVDGDAAQLRVRFTGVACALSLAAGDLVQQGNVVAEVVAASDSPAGAVIDGLRVRVVHPVGAELRIGNASLRIAYSPARHAAQVACFVRFTDSASPPAAQIAPASALVVRFDEAMDSTSLSPFDNLIVARTAGSLDASDFIVGRVTPTGDATGAEFRPTVPMAHELGVSETYWLRLGAGLEGPRDLAGNPLAAALPAIPFRIATFAASVASGGIVLRMNGPDDAGLDGLPELRGTMQIDIDRGVLLPRPVARQSLVIDRTNPLVANMGLISLGVQTPLSGLGSRLQTIWRYCDGGLVLDDETTMNLDVEGMAWAPNQPTVTAERFSRFEIALSHARFLPDESLVGVVPQFPTTGLLRNLAQNRLDATNDPERIVHPRGLGYDVSPSDTFLSSTGKLMMPWPLNRGIPPSEYRYYTWRDTTLLARGAPAPHPGVELPIVRSTLGSGTGGLYTAGNVPSFAMPLLMDFKCFVDDGALGLNSFDVALAAPANQFPAFRAFSTGGIDVGNVTNLVDPDLVTIASGGFNPNSTPPGATTAAFDGTFYMGQLDLVVRVTHVHSRWFDSALGSPTYASAVLEPSAANLPQGTRVDMAWRGATSVAAALLTNADLLDEYGNRTTGAQPSFLNGDSTWKSSLGAIQGARYFQARFTLVSNAATNLAPELSTFALAWRAP